MSSERIEKLTNRMFEGWEANNLEQEVLREGKLGQGDGDWGRGGGVKGKERSDEWKTVSCRTGEA